MQQRVPLVILVSFDDSILQKDVDEALVDAVTNLTKMLKMVPKLKGVSKTGKKVEFKLEGLEPPLASPTTVSRVDPFDTSEATRMAAAAAQDNGDVVPARHAASLPAPVSVKLAGGRVLSTEGDEE